MTKDYLILRQRSVAASGVTTWVFYKFSRSIYNWYKNNDLFTTYDLHLIAEDLTIDEAEALCKLLEES